MRQEEIEIFGDGRTVWVNTNDCCIGRFGNGGVDIHKDAEGQLKDGTECLECFPRTKDLNSDWTRFVAGMKHYYGVTVDDSLKPTKGRPWVCE